MCKCRLPEGVTIKPDGIHELDPCIYVPISEYRNVTIRICRCEKCGHVDISWMRQEDTVEMSLEEDDIDG